MMLQQLSDDTYSPETYRWPSPGAGWSVALVTLSILFLGACVFG
jgi:hypothetical protein